MEFEVGNYTISETGGILSVPIVRHGDLRYESSVICYTRQASAHVMEDYGERILGNVSRIYFVAGEKVGLHF